MAGLKWKITKRTVDAARAPVAGERRIWDTEVRGFVLRVYPSGRKVYALKCRVSGRQHIHTIGVHGSPWTPDQARAAAVEALRQAKNGEDPSAAKKAEREAVTVAGLIRSIPSGRTRRETRQAREHLENRCGEPQSAHSTNSRQESRESGDESGRDARYQGCCVGQDCDRRKKRGRAGERASPAGKQPRDGPRRSPLLCLPGVPNTGSLAPIHSQALNSIMHRFANASCRRARRGGSWTPLRTFKTNSYCQRRSATPSASCFSPEPARPKFLACDGRKVDQLRNVLILPPERTKAGGKTGERRISLSAPALEILSRRRARLDTEIPARGSLFVFPAARGEGHAIGLRRAFTKVGAEANLDGLRIHDLRHSFASFAVADGASLFLIGKLLGHANARATERYAHLSNDPLQDAANQIGRRIMGGRKQGGELAAASAAPRTIA